VTVKSVVISRVELEKVLWRTLKKGTCVVSHTGGKKGESCFITYEAMI